MALDPTCVDRVAYFWPALSGLSSARSHRASHVAARACRASTDWPQAVRDRPDSALCQARGKEATSMQLMALFVGLVVMWLLWSGLYLPLLLWLGLASCLLVVWLVRRFETVDQESVPLSLGWRIVPYWIWLIKEIAVSSLTVARIVLSPRLPISPRLVRVKSLASTELGRVVLANSITLTPGTLTTDIDEQGMITVHALTAEGAADIEAGVMNRRVNSLETR
jgi:multicomponent Na+:H+ antiporter subunit E